MILGQHPSPDDLFAEMTFEVGEVSGSEDADDENQENGASSFENYLQNILAAKHVHLSVQDEDTSIDFYNEARDGQRLSKSITNVFSSANQMTRSLVSTAATKTFSVTSSFASI